MMAIEKKFEDKIKELEEIINVLESGEVSLDDSIKKYTEAMKLVKECDSELKNIEDKVNKIVTENGNLEDLKFQSKVIMKIVTFYFFYFKTVVLLLQVMI